MDKVAVLKDLLKGLEADELQAFATEVNQTVASRRPRFDMDSIRPGMTEAETAAACSEIQRVLREGD